jgi:aspartate/methionine/tyrosine aminotransferase
MFERTKNLRLSIIKQIEMKASEYTDVISLAQGIPSFDTPQCIKGRAQNALKEGTVARYSLSPGLPELRELIEISLARENMFYDWQNEIIVTAGSIEAITATMLAITMPGDEIIIPEPTYTSYREVITLAGCKTVEVPLIQEKGWMLDIEKFESAITPKTRAIFYCNPNNPTGTIYSREELLGLAELAKKHELFLISDDVYKDFPLSENGKIFSLAELPELRDRVIRIFSFSKAYAMTGWRVGYVHSDAKVIAEILKVHDALVTCAPVISQYAAMGALEMGEIELRGHHKHYIKRRDIICERLDRLIDSFSYVRPQGAYYVFPKIMKGEKDSWKFTLDLLDKAQVAVVPGFAFGPSGEGHFRLNFGRSEEDIMRAMDRIEKYCAE